MKVLFRVTMGRRAIRLLKGVIVRLITAKCRVRPRRPGMRQVYRPAVLTVRRRKPVILHCGGVLSDGDRGLRRDTPGRFTGEPF